MKVPATIATKKNKTIKSEHEPTDKRKNCHKDTEKDLNENGMFTQNRTNDKIKVRCEAKRFCSYEVKI